MGDKTVQELIDEILNIKNDKDAIIKKQNEILYKIIENGEIYTLLSKETTKEQFNKGTASIYCSYNSIGRPSFWIFSEKALAEACATRGKFVIKTGMFSSELLIKKLDVRELLDIAYNSMFRGVSDIIIDDGANWLNVSIKDLINSFFTQKGEKELIPEDDYKFINLFNSLKLDRSKNAYIIADRNSSFEQIFSYAFKLDINDNNISIFTNKDTAEKYAKDNLGSDFYAVQANVFQLNNRLIEMVKDRQNYNVRINYENEICNYEFGKIISLMGKMT